MQAFSYFCKRLFKDNESKAKEESPFDSEIVQKAIAESKDPLAVLLDQRGGLKGGKARAKKLSTEKRKEIAQKAAKARWKKKP